MRLKYKKMLAVMAEKEKNLKQSGSKYLEKWFLYILKCKDGTFYTGITKDLKRRFKMHNDGKASHYTRTRRPVQLLFHEACKSRTQAMIRECVVKALPRKKKEELIKKPRSN